MRPSAKTTVAPMRLSQVRPYFEDVQPIGRTTTCARSAEWDWLERCGGAARGPALNARDYPTATSLFERWGQVETAVRDFLSTLRASVVSGLDKVIESIVLARLRQWWVDLVARA
jgi:hypothetical protein